MRYRRFEELPIWKSSLTVTRQIYDLTANPKWSKDFGLRDQARRAIVSFSSNVVEGFEKGNNNEFIRYLRIAKGSVGEVRNQLYIALTVGYITQKEFDSINKELVSLANQVGGFIQYLELHRPGRQSAIRNPQSVNLGFTILEMLIVLGLFLFIGAFSLMSLRQGGNIQDARREALRLVAKAREMERRTLSGSLATEVGITAPRGGYGIKISADGTSYAAVVAPNVDDLATLSTLSTITLPKSMSISPTNFTFLFTQPKGVVCAQEAGGTRYCGLCRVFDPGTTTCLSPIPLANTSQQKQTLSFSMDQPNIARVVINLVAARLSAQ